MATIEEMRVEQKALLEEQDEGLEELSKVLRRQREMGLAIGREVDDHIDIIHDITKETDQVHIKLDKTTQRVNRSRQKNWACTCVPWVVVAVLFLVIIIVAVVPFGGKP